MANRIDYQVSPARYAKNSFAVRPLDSKAGLMGRTSRILGSLRARWTHRERAYIVSPSKLRKFEALFSSGKDAHLEFHGIYNARYVLDDG